MTIRIAIEKMPYQQTRFGDFATVDDAIEAGFYMINKLGIQGKIWVEHELSLTKATLQNTPQYTEIYYLS